MKLRSQIFLLLFVFSLAPLIAAFAITVPLIFDRIESLYHKAYLQNLRAGFGDLDQHIARRHEMVRLLAKLPEPGMLDSANNPQLSGSIGAARTNYLSWINQVFYDQLDITQILFLDVAGQIHFQIDRNNVTGRLEQSEVMAAYYNREFVEAGLGLRPGNVLTGPIIINRDNESVAPNRVLQLGLISAVTTAGTPLEPDNAKDKQGVVIIYLDVGGLVVAYRGMYWAQSDGRYLGYSDSDSPGTTAFDDFPGLQELFANGELGLWESKGQRAIWMPLFATEKSGPLWVGRSVDPSPIAKLRQAIELRVIGIVMALLLVVIIVARLIALRTGRLGSELTDGIARVLEKDDVVKFSWQRPEELRTLGKNLTRLAETHAEHNKALYDYARELEDSNRYKSEFLANVSHELRTPLNSILLLSKMLEDSSAERSAIEESKQASVIHGAGIDLKALIDNILDLSRIEAGQISLLPERIDLRDVLDDIIGLLMPQFDEKGLSLALEIDESAPRLVVTDKEKLRQVLVNFLSNAVKFTREGGVILRLQPNRFDDAEQYPVLISVTDTGIGIAADKKEIIFEAFKQADGSTSRKYGGTGLGLTISRELAELMGGHIKIESEPGKGSTFSLLLPLEMAQIQHGSQGAPLPGVIGGKQQVKKLPVADYGGARVLLVDDDMRNLLAMTPLLEQWNIVVMAAGDGHEALETLEADGNFELVLLDIMMPEMDGYEVIRRIRGDERYARLPVIALTARAGDEDRRQTLEAGADECLIKPVEPESLKMMLDTYLGSSDNKHASQDSSRQPQ